MKKQLGFPIIFFLLSTSIWPSSAQNPTTNSSEPDIAFTVAYLNEHIPKNIKDFETYMVNSNGNNYHFQKGDFALRKYDLYRGSVLPFEAKEDGSITLRTRANATTSGNYKKTYSARNYNSGALQTHTGRYDYNTDYNYNFNIRDVEINLEDSNKDGKFWFEDFVLTDMYFTGGIRFTCANCIFKDGSNNLTFKCNDGPPNFIVKSGSLPTTTNSSLFIRIPNLEMRNRIFNALKRYQDIFRELDDKDPFKN